MNYLIFALFMFFSITLNANVNQLPITVNENLTVKVIESNYKKVGSAQFSVFFWDIYNSTLYTETGKFIKESSQQTIVFNIDYLKDITRDDLIDRTIEQWQHLNIPKKHYLQFLPYLTEIWPNISAGDSLTLLIKNQESFFYFNGTFIGNIKQKTFGSLFLSIWLSEKTSQKTLRRKLLGEHKP